jgi:hypothetical protein
VASLVEHAMVQQLPLPLMPQTPEWHEAFEVHATPFAIPPLPPVVVPPLVEVPVAVPPVVTWPVVPPVVAEPVVVAVPVPPSEMFDEAQPAENRTPSPIATIARMRALRQRVGNSCKRGAIGS